MKESEPHTPPARIVRYLFKSDFYEVKTWTLDFDRQTSFAKEFNDCLCIVHVQRGTLNKKMYQLTTGNVTIERPNFEYQLLPSCGLCTIINFTDEFYAQVQEELQMDNIFKKQGKEMLSVQTSASPESEFVLRKLLSNVRQRDCVYADSLVVDFFNELFSTTPMSRPRTILSQSHNRHHQDAVEAAKEYLLANFHSQISLAELSRHCGISLFYLSRLFKRYTEYSPYQYLSKVRLKHGEMLLKETSCLIADIAYASGFTSPEYFATLFKQRYRQSPTSYRLKI